MTNNLKFYRELRGFTQEEVASFVGLSRNSISSIERGDYLPTLRNAFLIARSLVDKILDPFFCNPHKYGPHNPCCALEECVCCLFGCYLA